MAIMVDCVVLAGGLPPDAVPLASGTINEPSGIRKRMPEESCHNIGKVAEF
jgi:hypothetical protein